MSTLATTVAVSGDYSRRKWQQMYTLYTVFSTATIVVEIGESVDRALIVNNIISKTRFQFSSFQSMLQLLPRRLWSQYGPTPKGSQQLFAYEKIANSALFRIGYFFLAIHLKNQMSLQDLSAKMTTRTLLLKRNKYLELYQSVEERMRSFALDVYAAPSCHETGK